MENALDLSRQILRNMEKARLNHKSGNIDLLMQDLAMAAILAESLVRAINLVESQIEG